MIAVIFEVNPHDQHRQEYFDIAGELRPLLENIEGFISIERFESLTQPGKLLSLSFWRNEEAIAQWRNLESHRQAQTKGRKSIFSSYRIRIATVDRDYGMSEREQVPGDSLVAHSHD